MKNGSANRQNTFVSAVSKHFMFVEVVGENCMSIGKYFLLMLTQKNI